MSRRAAWAASVLTGLSALMLSACTTPAHLQADGSDALTPPLTATPGDAARGRAIVANRQVGLCLLCHSGPFPEERFQGNLAPSLAGAGLRWSEGQLRLRVSDTRRLNPASIMPAYHPAHINADASARVGAAWKAKPILDAQQVEDVVAFLRTLREP